MPSDPFELLLFIPVARMLAEFKVRRLREACKVSYSTSLRSISKMASAVSFDFRSFFLKPAFLSKVLISLGISLIMKV